MPKAASQIPNAYEDRLRLWEEKLDKMMDLMTGIEDRLQKQEDDLKGGRCCWYHHRCG